MIGMSTELIEEIAKNRTMLREYAESQNRETAEELAAADPADVPRPILHAAQRDARYKWPSGVVSCCCGFNI